MDSPWDLDNRVPHRMNALRTLPWRQFALVRDSYFLAGRHSDIGDILQLKVGKGPRDQHIGRTCRIALFAG